MHVSEEWEKCSCKPEIESSETWHAVPVKAPRCCLCDKATILANAKGMEELIYSGGARWQAEHMESVQPLGFL